MAAGTERTRQWVLPSLGPGLYRFPLLALGMLALLAALAAGLERMGWPLSPYSSGLAGLHGPLMACGFLGTLISLERAVAAGRPWGYGAPALAGLGAAALLTGWAPAFGMVAIDAASLGLLLLTLRAYRLRADLPGQVIVLGAAAWLAGNTLWLAGRPLSQAAWCWLGFLVLTIGGERLGMAQLTRGHTAGRSWFLVAVGLLLAGVLLVPWDFDRGVRLGGAGLLALGLWLLRFDFASGRLPRAGLPRFVSLALVGGYGWLTIGGLMALALGAVHAGPAYDATLHAVFLGFVFSAIMAHAPIVFPAIANRAVAFRPALYAPLALLHVSLFLRLVGDLTLQPALRQWAGLLNAVTVVLFMGVMVYTLARGVDPQSRTI